MNDMDKTLDDANIQMDQDVSINCLAPLLLVSLIYYVADTFPMPEEKKNFWRVFIQLLIYTIL